MNLLDSIVSQPIVSLDWDVRTLRLVHATVSKRAYRIDQLLAVSVPEDVRTHEAESMGAFVRRVLSQSGIKTRRALIDVPRDYGNLYTLSLPKASLSDLAAMVSNRIPRELPYPVDQAAIDFIVPPEDELQTTNDVVVGAVRQERLGFYHEVAQHAGLRLLRLGLRPNASQFAINALLKTTPHERVLFVDVGPKTTEIDVLRNGRLVFSRAADVVIPDSFDDSSESIGRRGGEGAPGGTEPALTLAPTEPGEQSLNSIVKAVMIEVTRSIEAYRSSDPGATMDHAVIGGSCDIEEALADAIQRQYKITAQPYNPATCFGWEADRGADAGAYAAALGLVLAHVQDSRFKFDFLHPKRSVTQAERRLKRAPVAVATAVLCVGAAAAWYVKFIRPQYQLRERLTARVAEVEDELKAHGEFEEFVAALQRFDEAQVVWPDELYEMLSALPDNKELVLGSLAMTQKGRHIRVPFQAKQSRLSMEVVKSLEAYRLPDEKGKQFEAVLGATTEKEREKYPHFGTLDVRIVEGSRSAAKTDRGN